MAFALLLALLPAGIAKANSGNPGITVAVASNFRHAMQALVSEYQAQQPSQQQWPLPSLQLVFGASGQLAAQIQNGAPFAAFYAADQSFAASVPNPIEIAQYARGRLVLVSARHDDPLSLLKAGGHSLSIANPKLAPYGRAALETLQQLSAAGAIKLIRSSNISRAALHALRGTTDLGLIASADLPSDWPAQRQWRVPQSAHMPIDQYAALLDQRAADFFRFTLSAQAQSMLRQYGYE